MILNQYIPEEILQRVLPDQHIKSLDLILDSLDKNKTKPVLKDLELLGNIHHAVNMDQYRKASFRIKLLYTAPNELLQNYFKACNVIKTISDMNAREVKDTINKISNFQWGNNNETNTFIKCFNYPDYLIPKNPQLEKNDDITYGGYGAHKLFEPLKMLMSYQAQIVYRSLDKLRIPSARFLIQMPTGTGKTRTAMEIVAHYLNENSEHQIMWLTDSVELLSQAVDTFKHVWQHVGKFDINTYRIWGSNDPQEIKNGPCIIFAGYQKLINLFNNNFSIHPDLIINDEAHRILAPKYNKLLYRLMFSEKNVKLIGLTATPGRGINPQQNKLLVEEFHEQLIGIELEGKKSEQYENNIVSYLEDEGVLAKHKLDTLETNVKIELSDKEWRHLVNLINGDLHEYSEELLKSLAEDNTRNLLIIKKLQKYANQNKKILYFGTSIDQTILVSVILTKLGINSVYVDGKTDKDFRKEVVDKFKHTDEINVICNYGIFATGFDVPDLDVVFIGRPVNSPVLFNQIVGRGTRGPKMGGSEYFDLVQVIDKISHEDPKFDPYEHYLFWDENWNSDL